MVAQSVDAQIRRSALARDKTAVVCQTDCVIVLRGQASLQQRTVGIYLPPSKAQNLFTCSLFHKELSMSQPTAPIHHPFIKTSVPSWYVYTTADLRERLHRDMLRSHHLRSQMQQTLSGLQDLTSFARPILANALEQNFGFGLDVDRDHFRHVTFADNLLPLPSKLVDRSFTVQSLLQAALQNFHQEEVDAVTADSVIFHGTPNLATLAAKTSYPHPLKIAPAKFMALCRKLDLGGRYQAHIKAVLEPVARAVPAKGLNSTQIKNLLRQQMRNALYVEAHVARMQGAEVLSSGAYDSILAATEHWAAPKTAWPVDIQYLKMLGFTLRDVLVFQPRGLSGCVVYIPDDPTAPLKEYDSFDQFMRLLRTKLRDAHYQQYFAGFVAQRRRAEFISKLRDCLTPQRTRPVPGDTGLIPRQWVVSEVDENANLNLEVEKIPYPLLDYFHFQRMLRIKDDARAIAVPTGDEDQASRQKRLAHYLELGMNAVNLAALFVPVLGEVMMVVAGSQLLVDTFEGIEAWAHNDMDEALKHLASVAENLAMLAAFAAAGKAALPVETPAIKDSSFVGKMIPVKLADGQTRLWSPDLAPFSADVVLPSGMKPSAEGVFNYQGTNYIGIEGRFYRVELDTTLNKWRLKAPRGKRFTPQLEDNGAGAWRHDGENPLHWDLKTSFRRLGYTVCDHLGKVFAPESDFYTAVVDAMPEGVMSTSGLADATALRQRLASDATSQRKRVAKVLGLQEIAPGFRGPARLANRRFGYEMSGRGAGAFLPDLPDQPANSDELIAMLTVLYPEAPSLAVHVQNLMFRGWSMPQLLEATRARLQSWEVLHSALEGWVHPIGPGPAISSERFAVRRSVADALGRAWRFSDSMSPMHSSNLLFEGLDFRGFSDMPDLPQHYAEINYLTLSRVTGGAEDINRLLGRFPRVRRLEIMGGGLTQLPDGLAGMQELTHLSLEGMGLTIDQAAFDLFMRIRNLDELDLTGNIIGEFTDIERLRLSTLWLNDTGLTQWPAWAEHLGLRSLDISDNQIVHLPNHIVENSQNQVWQLTIHAYDNPIDHEDLRLFWINDRGYDMAYRLEYNFPEEIRDLVVDTTTSDEESSSDDDTDWHAHNAGHTPYAPPLPVLDIWLVEGRTELNSRLRIAWEQVETASDAPNLLVLLQRLHEAPDFRRFHEELANDVMRVLEAAAADPALRAELEIMANDRLFGSDQTCEDGARLIFSDIQVAVYARNELQGVPEAQHTEVLFRVIRGLFCLNEVQAIADMEILVREARGVQVDEAEVRMAYRIGLASDLNLPGQPLSMAWSRLASVDRQAILAARRQVLEREAGDEFVNYAVADRRWNDRLRAEHQAELTRATASIRAQMDALEEHPPSDHDEYDRQGRALIASLQAAEKALLEQLTSSMRQKWF